MELTGNDYLGFIKDDKTLFYQPNNNHHNGFKYLKPTGNFYDYSDNYWHYILFNHQLPEQGWKIHISANVKDAQQLLLAVSKYLTVKHVTYKFVNTLDELVLSNSKYGDRAGSGKFITVYPRTDKEFVELLDELAQVTSNFLEGPYILSDKEWHDTHIFYRYGAFKEIKARINGKEVYCIKDNHGNLIEDKRVPYYQTPKFIVEPAELKSNVQQYDKFEFKQLMKYRIDSALHFSNAGGVYHATLNGNECVLKEGRAYAGLDANGLDGFKRVEREYKALAKLHDVPETVNVYEKFKAWKHLYLVEEYLEGDTLADFIDSQYPFTASKVEKKKYAQKCTAIINALTVAVEHIHSYGLAIGDLQPDNVILLNLTDNIIKLIDFENSQKLTAKYQPGMATPGYADVNAHTFGEADNIALYKIARYMILPIASDFDWAPEMEQEQDKNIADEFGPEIVDFFHCLKNKLSLNFNTSTRHPQHYQANLFKPKTSFDIDNLDKNISEIAQGIIQHLDFDFMGLIRGDITEYDSQISYYSVANGAFGAIMALTRSNCLNSKINHQIHNWIDYQITNIKKLLDNQDNNSGLFTGLTGIAVVLAEQGYQELSKLIMDKLLSCKLNQDISIYSGISGVGLAYLTFYLQNNDEKYLRQAQLLAKKVSELTQSEIYTKECDSGLLTGWLGAALFLWKMYVATQSEKYRIEALRILHLVLNNSLEINQTVAYIKDNTLSYERLMPYVNHGSAGLALLLIEFIQDSPESINQNEKAILQKLIKANDVFVTYLDGLFDGFISLIVLDTAVANLTDDNRLAHKLKLLNNYIVGQNDVAFVQGRFGYKLSLDLTTGNSGLLLVLNDIKQHKWGSWMPLFKSNKFKLFC
ncbi:class III lanthionine synthetase LanKC [Lactobacillus sp. ESL0785]|uniref:class III lanthionine synthetase LanKC n=1 Tax=Lactobacillus sp. ESL0785 TaxID=2983232 RepID=UPI0023F86E0E|nr:class III lanthionine synthetase LanKC [Lactobacillus sp. ESL0785]WEV70429.1 class III lanthionine synthetase LanKC [Lactobacillus sp. ESL0785]